jgi:hypothetical protein
LEIEGEMAEQGRATSVILETESEDFPGKNPKSPSLP